MEGSVRQLLAVSVSRYNVLPLTSLCNVSCLFCSHKQNMPGLETICIPPLSRIEFEHLVTLLDPGRKIVIGESATRVMEGEPFTHPQCLELLETLRKKFPQTPLQVTTNGTLLTRQALLRLKALEPLEINLSLNSASVRGRTLLMKDPKAMAAIRAVEYLSELGLIFHGSIVPLPWVTGWDDVYDTLRYLERGGACTIRVFIPGFTRFTKLQSQLPQQLQPPSLMPPPGWEEELVSFLQENKKGLKTPLTLEPPYLQDLTAEIAGVISGSPAAEAGLKRGQVIAAIDGEVPFSRVEAFYRLQEPGTRRLKVRSPEEGEEEITLSLGRQEKSGLVMDYDLSRQVVEKIAGSIRKKKGVTTLILSSEWGAPLLAEGLKRTAVQGSYRVLTVKNRTFGGTIRSAGLLLVDDFRYGLNEYLQAEGEPGQVFLPALAFDYRGRDLAGRSYHEVSDRLAGKIKLMGGR